ERRSKNGRTRFQMSPRPFVINVAQSAAWNASCARNVGGNGCANLLGFSYGQMPLCNVPIGGKEDDRDDRDDTVSHTESPRHLSAGGGQAGGLLDVLCIGALEAIH